MKWFIDGDYTVVTDDDFINLQESNAIFIHEDHPASTIIREKGIAHVPLGDLFTIKAVLDQGGGVFPKEDQDEPYYGRIVS